MSQVQKEALKNEAKKVHHILTTYALIHPGVRFSLTNPPRPVLRKLAVPDLAVRSLVHCVRACM